MKRIKPEEIQNTIRNYVLHRNLSSAINFLDKTSNTNSNSNSEQTNSNVKLSKSQLINNNNNNYTIDLNKMALNDLSLIESSINDYYAYSFSSTDRNDYLKQFDLFKKFVESNQESEDLSQMIFPLFVYLCIDLVSIGFSIKDIVNNYINENQTGELFDKDQRFLLENLLLYDENHDLAKCYYVNKWSENKCKIKLCSKSWKILLKFLTNSKCFLLLRIFNINLQIMIGNFIENLEEKILNQKKCPNSNLSIKKEKIDVNENTHNSTTLNNLIDVINKVKSQPTKIINSVCTFYLNDEEDSQNITSSNISPNLDYLSFTSEQSSIYLYKLIDYEINENKNKNSCDELIGGHSGAIFKSKFTHDSKYLISCGEDGLACLWDLKNSTIACSYSGHLSPVWDIEPFSSYNLFSTCSKDTTARLWSFDRLYPLRVFCGHQSDVNSVRFHPNGSYLATGSSDKTVRLWSVQSSEFVRLFSGHRSRVFCVAFSPNGYYLASAGEDKKIKIWDLRTGGLYKELKGHTDIIHSICFDNHSEMLASGGLDRTVKFWDVTTTNRQSSLKSSSSLTSSWSSSSSTSSSNNDLIRSINVDFDVYSIHCDIQNVFYLSGALKKSPQNQIKLNLTHNMKQISSDLVDYSEPNLISMPTQKLKLPIHNTNNSQFMSFNQNNDNNINVKTRTPVRNKSNQLPVAVFSQTQSNTTSSSSSSSFDNVNNSNSNVKSTINTRRRTAAAAAAAAAAASAAPSQHLSASSNNENNDNNCFQDSTSYLFNNNDDLYEV